MNERQRRAWQALDLGPRWVLRTPKPAPNLPSAVPDDDVAEVVGQVCGVCGQHWTRAALVPLEGGGQAAEPWLVVAGELSLIEALAVESSEPVAILWPQLVAALGIDRARMVFLPVMTRSLDASSVPRCGGCWRAHLALMGPCVVLTLGEAVAQIILEGGADESALRGRTHEVPHSPAPVRVVVTDDLRVLLDHPLKKAQVWRDLCQLKQALTMIGLPSIVHQT